MYSASQLTALDVESIGALLTYHGLAVEDNDGLAEARGTLLRVLFGEPDVDEALAALRNL